MALRLDDVSFLGPALPEPFVRLELEDHLRKKKLLTKTEGAEGKKLEARWETFRRRLRKLGEAGGATRVFNHVLEPLVLDLGYESNVRAEPVVTREGDEDGGWVCTAAAGGSIRAWAWDLGTDLDAPSRRGRAYRFSPSRVAQRVLLAKGERVGLLTDGQELRLLLCDPARPESHLAVRLDRAGGWRSARGIADSYRLVLALASPAGVAALPDLLEAARLNQTEVTQTLRHQARRAVETFAQELLDHPSNRERLHGQEHDELARALWRESLVLVYRLLFTLKLESSADPARAFSFASTSLWRQTYSPNVALGPVARKALEGAETGGFLESGLRTLFRMFSDGMTASELVVKPLGGALFGPESTPLIDKLAWGERAVALLLDNILWTPGTNKAPRQRVHYGSLDVEDLGRVYEALLDLEPGIAQEPMCRLRRDKLEVVLPAAQGEPYRNTGTKKAKVEWIELIAKGRFYLRVGLGRKATGSYYTPHPFVRFLVQETLGPQVAERSPPSDPRPTSILALNVLDPAMGSGHFLVEACRFLGEKLYEACRLCDERALEEESKAEKAKSASEKEEALTRAAGWRERVAELPDPNDELLAYLPSRVAEGLESGLSQKKAEALCRRLVAVHCLYGVDKNPLAVALAKVSLWLESYAEGLPLTFLDHRLVIGDSLTGPFFDQLLRRPVSGAPIEGLFAQKLTERLSASLQSAFESVEDLEASVGKDVGDLTLKAEAKERLDAALEPLINVARTWTGALLFGEDGADSAYESCLLAFLEGRGPPHEILASIEACKRLGAAALPYDLQFPEIFLRKQSNAERTGFNAVLGNPPWDALQPLAKEFYAAFDLRVLDAPTRRERSEVEARLNEDAAVSAAFQDYVADFDSMKRLVDRTYRHVNRQAGGAPSGAVTDIWQVFAERSARLLSEAGSVGLVLPSAFHANQSATGIRELYLKELALASCFSFENRNQLFEIDSRFKFAALVARRQASGTEAFDCAFYLHDLEWLFEDHPTLRYTREFVHQTGGDYWTFLELRSAADLGVAETLASSGVLTGSWLREAGIRFGEEMHMSKSSHLFADAPDLLNEGADPRDPGVANELRARGYLPLHEGKTFHQYDDRWGEPPRYLVALDDVRDKPAWLTASRHYRLAFRDIARSTDERTGIFCLLPPGVLCGNTAPCERQPAERTTTDALLLLALADSHAFDWAIRQKAAAHVNLFILNGCPVPSEKRLASRTPFLAHAALRLSANHEGYAALWREQLGKEWRESRSPGTWPVVEGSEERWAVRATIDAVVADAYGLTRDQYAHVLASFSHSSYAHAPEHCLSAFDEIQKVGFESFAKRHDPYFDVPLHSEVAQPVIDFPAPKGELSLFGETTSTKRKKGRRAPEPVEQEDVDEVEE